MNAQRLKFLFVYGTYAQLTRDYREGAASTRRWIISPTPAPWISVFDQYENFPNLGIINPNLSDTRRQ